ncbi:hypothetical protein DLAC_05479 [Tieghemostelium lacteum]|uniref:Uncharacterized protein n=1 Tax=Tieghemostelium lacteum TaxID=361077 RepID=A0A151ZFZ3_TIELA|nr:hypothetical protein DLAC_05479 [Tieghemostelium lacteum]|eukprot:KYQ92888.1 hypothetical protein DLAC_05479 [Tieghemostelium lacteum]
MKEYQYSNDFIWLEKSLEDHLKNKYCIIKRIYRVNINVESQQEYSLTRIKSLFPNVHTLELRWRGSEQCRDILEFLNCFPSLFKLLLNSQTMVDCKDWDDSLIPPQLEEIEYLFKLRMDMFDVKLLNAVQGRLKLLYINSQFIGHFNQDSDAIKQILTLQSPKLEYLYIDSLFDKLFINHFHQLKILSISNSNLEFLIEHWSQFKKLHSLILSISESINTLFPLLHLLNENSNLTRLKLVIDPGLDFRDVDPMKYKEPLHFHNLIDFETLQFPRKLMIKMIIPSLKFLYIGYSNIEIPSLQLIINNHQNLVKLSVIIQLKNIHEKQSEELSLSLSQLPSLEYLSLSIYHFVTKEKVTTHLLKHLHLSKSLEFIQIQTNGIPIPFFSDTPHFHPQLPFQLVNFSKLLGVSSFSRNGIHYDETKPFYLKIKNYFKNLFN